MATRYRALSKSTVSLFKHAVNKPAGVKPTPTSAASLFPARPSSTFSRPIAQLGALQSLLPLHSAVASARLTSCLGIDSTSSRSLSQGMLCSANPGV
ncbi:unnamed protein product [Linum tenue]|uniref:Uncharacterized protein n=2 Tax=Linum tenue TaxID=586396 RepID=A0AAV0JGH3_9ROSI|nr:unnamed protein product [Linum tenue]CAI0409595.1 unnamed protein product [Linum tenue]